MTARRHPKGTSRQRAHKKERLDAPAKSAVRARRFSAAETVGQNFERVESGRDFPRASEDQLSAKALGEILEARRQIREGGMVSMDHLESED